MAVETYDILGGLDDLADRLRLYKQQVVIKERERLDGFKVAIAGLNTEFAALFTAIDNLGTVPGTPDDIDEEMAQIRKAKLVSEGIALRTKIIAIITAIDAQDF